MAIISHAEDGQRMQEQHGHTKVPSYLGSKRQLTRERFEDIGDNAPMFAPAKQRELGNEEAHTRALAAEAFWLLLDPQLRVDLWSDFSSAWLPLPSGRREVAIAPGSCWIFTRQLAATRVHR